MATTSKNQSDNSKKAIDVAKPGKTSPDASSRPVIVTHKPMIKDPMMKDEAAETPQAQPVKVNNRSKVIAPPSKTDASAQPVEPEAAEAKPAEEEVTPETSATDTTQNETADTSADEQKAAEKDAAIVDAVAEQADKDKQQSNELTEEEKQRQAELDKLIADKKYFVPIGQVTKRKNNRRTLMILLVLALLLVGLYLAVDAEVVDIGISVPFELI